MKLVIPPFKTEREEADWWERHRAEVEADMRAAIRAGKTIPLREVLIQASRKKEGGRAVRSNKSD
jgi:hypothetical protein